MKVYRARRFPAPLACLMAVLAVTGFAVASDDPAEPALRRQYAFQPLITSKFNDGIAGLRAADVDGDGRTDLVLINNAKARIELLRQRRPGEELEAFDPERVNELPEETHFVREAHPIEQRVTSVAAADLNGDGRADLAYTGDSGRLTVVYRGQDDRYVDPVRFDVDNPSSSNGAVRAGDLDGDGDTDLALLGETSTYVFLQGDGGGLEPGPTLANATIDPDGFDLVDVDGDGTLDLLYVSAESDWPLRVRLGQGEAAFGPEMRSLFAHIRSYRAADLDGDGRAEIGAVRRRSGRFSLLELEQPAGAPEGRLTLSTPRLLPFESYADSGRRDLVLGDVDGDGRQDLLVAEPAAARLVVRLTGADGALGPPRVYPSFVGASSPRVMDIAGQRKVVVAAPAESAIGLADVDAAGRVGFPAALPVPGEDLLALDVADQDGDGAAEIWVVTGEGKSRKRSHTLARLDPGGSEPQLHELEELEGDPADLMLIDIDRDGRRDAVLFIPTRLPTILLARAEGFEALPSKDIPGLGILKGVARDAVCESDVDGDGLPELLVPGPNFARALAIADGTTRIVAQYNLPDPSAQVAAVGWGQLDGEGGPEILLIEASHGELHVLRTDEWESTEIGRVKLGDFTPEAVWATDLSGDGRADVVLPGSDRFATVRNGAADPAYTSNLEFELPVRDTSLDRIAFGDVNGDGVDELILTETNKHMICIAALRPDDIEYALKFRVFEQHVFGQGRGGREPRELLVADVTGDALQDIAIIVHDRVIVYPQD